MLDEFDFTETMETNTLIPDGEYEATIVKAEEKQLPSGNRVISLDFKIRDDVEQGCKGRMVYDSIWPSKDDPTKWDKLKIYQIIHNGQDANDKGVRMSFENLDDLIQYLNGINMRITVQKYTNLRTGDTKNEIKRGGYAPTRAKPKTVGAAQPDASVVDDGLPF